MNGLRPGGVLIPEAFTPEQLRRGTGGPPVAALDTQARGQTIHQPEYIPCKQEETHE
jgi:hypothetical protein